MSHRNLNLSRRRFLEVSVGGTVAAYLAIPGRMGPGQAAAQAEDLAFTGEIEFWDWEFDARQEAEDAIIADWGQRYPDINLSYQVLPYADAETKLLTAASAGEARPSPTSTSTGASTSSAPASSSPTRPTSSITTS